MRIHQTVLVPALILALGLVGGVRTAAGFNMDCTPSYTSVPAGTSYEFLNPISVEEPDSVDIEIETHLPPGWGGQWCQTSTGLCLPGDYRIQILPGLEPDTLRVDFFVPEAGVGMGYIRLRVRDVVTGQERLCVFTLFAGEPVPEAGIDYDCGEDAVQFLPSASLVEISSVITNTSSVDDSVEVSARFHFPDGWTGQFCDVSTGLCYTGTARLPIAALSSDSIRVDFFNPQGGSLPDGAGGIDIEVSSVRLPSIWKPCYYRLFVGDQLTDVRSGPEAVSSSLLWAEPNPFHGETTIRMHLDSAADGDLSIYSADGRRIRTFAGLSLPEGLSSVHWDGRDASGTRVAAGVYYYRLQAGEEDIKGVVVRSP